MNPADTRSEFHDSMVRRVEQARKAVDVYAFGRGRQGALARALAVVLEEVHERLEMAWRVLAAPAPTPETVAHQRFRAQKAAELGLCYTAISRSYDELVRYSVINHAERTEPTVAEIAKQLERQDKAATRSRSNR